MSLFDQSTLSLASVQAPAPVKPGMGDDAWLASSKALEPATPVTIPDMVRPFLPWQAAAFVYALAAIKRWGGALLGDDMGMGKTQVLLALAAHFLRTALGIGGRRPYAVIIAPLVTTAGYMGDVQAAFPNLRLHVVKGRTVRELPEADLYLLSDDPLTVKAWMIDEVTHDVNGNKLDKPRMDPSAFARGAAILLRDELHRDKGKGKENATDGVRANAMMALGKAFRQMGKPIVGATGTLLLNRPIESYLPLQVVGGQDLLMTLTPGASKHSSFKWRYCNPRKVHIGNGRYATDFSGIDAAAALDLHEYMRRTIYVRREKSDLPKYCDLGHANAVENDTCDQCGQELHPSLPNSGWLVSPLALDDVTMTRYRRIEKDLLNLILEEHGWEAMSRAQKAEAVVRMGKLRTEAGVAKCQASVEYIANLVDQGHQVVAFYHNTEVMHDLLKGLTGLRLTVSAINGKVKGDERVDVIQEFQSGDCDVVLCQIDAAGIGVTLTAAPHAVFVQLPWSAGALKQAADRILRCDDRTRDRARAGESVTWHVLQTCKSDGTATIDERIFGVLRDKAAVVDAINAGRDVTFAAGDDEEEAVQYEVLRQWCAEHGVS
jgi:hypothetical protein